MNIAHNEGNYFTNPEHLTELNDNSLVAFKYCDEKLKSMKIQIQMARWKILLAFLMQKNILGMMPHPERMIDRLISNTDGTNLFSSLLN